MFNQEQTKRPPPEGLDGSVTGGSRDRHMANAHLYFFPRHLINRAIGLTINLGETCASGQASRTLARRPDIVS